MGDEAEDIEARVARGAAFLDEWMPGWVDKIDLENLHMSSCAKCVLGQLFDDYVDAVFAFHMGTAKAIDLGFNGMTSKSSMLLTDAWRRLILSRREAADAPTR